MGVRGLTTLVKQRGRTAAEEVPAGSVLLVDGSGLVNFLLRGDRFELGGDYARLERMVETYVDRLRKTYRVVVYRDGEKRRMKEATRLKRLEQRREEWRTLETWVSTTGRFVGAAAAQLPRPTLAYECFYLCVARLGVKIVDCEEEADQELAKARGYVLAEDSDFMVFRQCRYVPLEEFEKLASKRPVRVYDRDSVAAALDIAPAERLVDLAILLGNDYTGHLPRQDLAKLCPLNDKAPPDQVLRWVVDQPPTWRVDAGGDEVAFSRAFYDLEPLDAFPFDPLPSEDEDDGAPTFLPDDDDDDDDENENADLRWLIDQAIQEHQKAKGPAPLTPDQLAFLRSSSKDQSTAKERTRLLTERPVALLQTLFAKVRQKAPDWLPPAAPPAAETTTPARRTETTTNPARRASERGTTTPAQQTETTAARQAETTTARQTETTTGQRRPQPALPKEEQQGPPSSSSSSSSIPD